MVVLRVYDVRPVMVQCGWLSLDTNNCMVQVESDKLPRNQYQLAWPSVVSFLYHDQPECARYGCIG
jgi:hypothetical protein